MAADSRSTHTDALATLGTIINEGEKRDAIHLGVEPIVAGENLRPGQHVGIGPDGKAYSGAIECTTEINIKNVGIVDPFIVKRGGIKAGERFWLIVYPRQITSLRHVWEHPDFPDSKETTPQVVQIVVDPVAHFKTRLLIHDPEAVHADRVIQAEANRLNTDTDSLIAHANQWEAGSSEYWIQGGDFEGASLSQQFWDAWAVMHGREPVNKDSWFSCSC